MSVCKRAVTTATGATTLLLFGSAAVLAVLACLCVPPPAAYHPGPWPMALPEIAIRLLGLAVACALGILSAAAGLAGAASGVLFGALSWTDGPGPEPETRLLPGEGELDGALSLSEYQAPLRRSDPNPSNSPSQPG
jgi:hypothetical protein